MYIQFGALFLVRRRFEEVPRLHASGRQEGQGSEL